MLRDWFERLPFTQHIARWLSRVSPFDTTHACFRCFCRRDSNPRPLLHKQSFYQLSHLAITSDLSHYSLSMPDTFCSFLICCPNTGSFRKQWGLNNIVSSYVNFDSMCCSPGTLWPSFSKKYVFLFFATLPILFLIRLSPFRTTHNLRGKFPGIWTRDPSLESNALPTEPRSPSRWNI